MPFRRVLIDSAAGDGREKWRVKYTAQGICNGIRRELSGPERLPGSGYSAAGTCIKIFFFLGGGEGGGRVGVGEGGGYYTFSPKYCYRSNFIGF